MSLVPVPKLPNSYYRHHKTKDVTYVVLYIGRCSANPSKFFVIYKSLKTQEVWVRPFEEFTGEVTVDGTQVKRFSPVE
jgi:hypothetical protein